MTRVIENIKLNEDYYIIRLERDNPGQMGQFYMLRAWDTYPLLSRPLSIFDTNAKEVSFLYKLVGQGTRILSSLGPGDDIDLLGPLGHGFPQVQGKIAMVGGGVGIAPLYLATKTLKAQGQEVDIYFSLRKEEILRKDLEAIGDKVLIRVNERVTDLVDYGAYDYIFTCGPEGLMKDVYTRAKPTKAQVYVSTERHMACGIGICYVCTCQTPQGNLLACKDGPVFLGDQYYG